ncbi:MAG: DUF47 family protein [Verrucomicrobiales bacterium]|nr:DUF47 family protein [Verrucomicrobiales bacterium]MCP5559357.1 DUF47 family protein [Verrucomicrobiaceae bacterium]
MISLQKLFGKSDVFYDLLEASAAEARASIDALEKLLADAPEKRTLEELVAARRKDKRITEQINEQLCRTFVTELEREDIEALSTALYKIPKTVEKIAERVIICRDKLDGVDFSRQLSMMTQAAGTVEVMIKVLRKKLHLELIKDHNSKLQHIEGEGDKLMLELLGDLYTGKYEPVRMIMLKDLYELMEKVIDRCRDAGNAVSQVVLKYS